MSDQLNSVSLLTNSLRRWVVSHLPVLKGDVLVSEMCFFERKNRADLVLANGQLTAFEVKSSNDRMSRWETQQKAYLAVFDKVWLCVHSRHLKKAYEALNPCVGLMVLDNYGGVVVLEEAKENKSQSLEAHAELLWRSEVDLLLASAGEKVKRSLRLAEARLEMLNKVPEAKIREAVLQAVKQRYSEYQISSQSSS